MYYNENDICQKCGKKLESRTIEYEYAHDGGIYSDSYRKVDENLAKNVGLGFYCNDCYSSIGSSDTDVVIKRAEEFLNKEIVDAMNDVENHYKLKIQELNNVKSYIEGCIQFLKSKNRLSELTKEELKLLTNRCYIYQPNYQGIQVGFCYFEQCSEVDELYKLKS